MSGFSVAANAEAQPLESALTRHAHAVQPPAILYELLSNFPPAWSSVITISAAERFCSSSLWIPWECRARYRSR